MKPRSSRHARPLPIRWQAYAVALLVFFAILFGGGGVEGPINNGVIQGFSAVLIALLIASHVHGSWPLPKAAVGFTLLFLALLLIVLVQLVPLPPEVWHSLPGRELAGSALALTGSSDEWRPLSLDPLATRRTAAAFLLPAAIIFGLLGATRREVLLVVRVVVAGAALSALIGALDLTLGHPSWLTFYEAPNLGAASGVFANSNHHSALLVSAMLCLGFLIRADRSRASGGSTSRFTAVFHPAWLLLPFFIAMTVASGSRSGIVLMLVAVPGAVLIGLGGRSPLLWLAGLAGAVLVVAVVSIFSPSGNALAIGQSFVLSEDSRYSFLPDVVFTLRQYWPWGSGLGTFIPVFAPNENLDVAGAAYVNHAHNDLVEWALETGILGTLWLVAAAAMLVWRIVSVARRRNQLRGSQFAAVLAGALILLVITVHSLVDYPVRIAAISATLAVAAGLVLSPLTEAPPRPISKRAGRWLFGGAVVAGLVVGGLVMRIFAAEAAIRDDNSALAMALRPQSGRALALAAEDQLRLRNAAAAQSLAREAIRRTPLNPTAVRVLAMSLPPEAALTPWAVASAMGWRDGPTQLWALQQALANGEFEIAAVRADAFLRTRSSNPEEYLSLLRMASLEPSFREALVDRVKLNPAWRSSFFALPSEIRPEELEGVHQLLLSLAAAGEQPTLREAAPTVSHLLESQRYEAAYELYRQVRGEGDWSSQLLDDGGFDRSLDDYRRNSTHFDWLVTPMAGITATVEEQDGRFLYIETPGTSAGILVRRYVPLSPGTYQLDYMRRGDPDSPEAIMVSIRCADGRQIGVSSDEPLSTSRFDRRYIRFEVENSCPMIVISVRAKPVGRPLTAEFDEFSLRRLSGS